MFKLHFTEAQLKIKCTLILRAPFNEFWQMSLPVTHHFNQEKGHSHHPRKLPLAGFWSIPTPISCLRQVLMSFLSL